MAERTARERTGRRAWRQWSKRREYKGRREARKNGVKYQPLMTWNEWRKANNEGIRPPEKLAKPPTAADLVGMTMGARKRVLQDELSRYIGDDDFDYGDVVAHFADPLRIGKLLRPCPGCPQCTDDQLRIVRALSRRMKLRVEVRRCNSSIIPSKFDYLAMLHRPGPAWNPVCGFGPMRQDAVRALCDVLLREGAEEFPISSCDGSGVLPAKSQRRQANG